MKDLLVIHLLLLFQTGTLTSNVIGGVACPGEVITFNCTQDPPDSAALLWNILGPGTVGQLGLVQFLFPDDEPPLNRPIASSGSMVDGTATLLSTSPTVESTLTLTVTAALLNGTRVECDGESEVIIIASPPSPPQNVMVTVVENGTTNVTVSITWDNGGGAVDGYTVQTSPPSTTSVDTPPDTTSARLVLSYNVRYTVNVTAVNCAGNNTSALVPVEFVGCPLPSNPNVTFKPYTSSAEGSVIYYKCSPGFIPEVRVMSVCGGDGRWDTDPDQYSCTEVDCGDPRLPENSTVIRGPSSGNRNGSEVTFRCNEGLFPSMEITIVCTSEERWQQDPEMIVCADQPVTCSHPSEPTNGFLGEVTSTTAEFGCDSDPQETMTAQCVATDTWNPDPAQEECSPVSTTDSPTTSGATGISAGGVAGAVTSVVAAVFVIIVAFVVVFVLRKKRSGEPCVCKDKIHRSSSPEETLQAEYSQLQHPGNGEYSVLQHAGPHGSSSHAVNPSGLVYADVGNFDQSMKRGIELSTISKLDEDAKVNYSEVTHKPAPVQVAAVDKLIDLNSLLIQLRDVANNWYELGEQLGITRDILNQIESHYTDLENRRVEMFSQYLELQKKPTWKDIAKALRKMRENKLAEDLENVYVTGVLPIQINMDAVPSTSYKHDNAPPPPLPPKSADFEYDNEQLSSPPPIFAPPKPVRHAGESSGSEKRQPPPVPAPYDDTIATPPRPPKSGEPTQPPRPPKAPPRHEMPPNIPPKPRNL